MCSFEYSDSIGTYKYIPEIPAGEPKCAKEGSGRTSRVSLNGPVPLELKAAT